MLKRIQHQVHRISQRHHEARHGRVSHRDGLACQHLLDKQRNHRTTRRHHVAITRAANHGVGAFQVAAGCDHDLFHHRLADAHGVDGVHGLVGAQAHHALDTGGNGRFQHVFSAQHVGSHRLHRVKFARRHLLERSGVKHIVHPAHGRCHAARIANIANVELELGMVVALAHVILLFLVTAENADF